MSFEVQFASPGDSPSLTETFLCTFADDFNRTMFPPTPEVRAWLERTFLAVDLSKTYQVMLKIVDPSNPSIVAAFAKWARPLHAGADQDRHDPAPSWPVDGDADLREMFFGMMERHHEELMGGRPHYYLEMLGVHPSFQGRGLASKLLKWGLARADEEGVEVYLSSSPEGRPMYEKNKFEQTKYPFSPWPGYEQVNMIRPAKK
ncbi:hypothetical protein N7532_009994 [Penicillium argentinense]|uniref:N-acetyltransferase domain-containing protein n=1 Tax=Penicillium argentinense TaxID=1131581 RepID=A0A9W9ENR3_9EURO|nr:uncharacterized protein N7532_009994 [Penicillium argentinense]KAJ5085223.1 hypothetical protein N7532_009994 [Penicillium argentinense]